MNTTIPAALLAAMLTLPCLGLAQQAATVGTYRATIETDLKTLSPMSRGSIDVLLEGPAPRSITASLEMPMMRGMDIEPPVVRPGGKPGHYTVSLIYPHPGDYRLSLTLHPVTGKDTVLNFDVKLGEGGMQQMAGMEMKGALGGWTANQEGSGTSWQPASSPMFMKMLPSLGGFELSTMGTVQAGYVDPGTKRVGPQTFTDSMIMLMGRKEAGGGTLGLDFMTSLDPIINGKEGVPDVFQTGETAYGVPLVDRQHPHNVFSELAASYSHPLGADWTGFIYGGPAGEPALGGVMFMHRPSGMEIPEAPITHHWFDSTHISFGVVTMGLAYHDRWKLEGSWFNGHEPGENRYELGPEGLNSGSGRLSFNPSKEWSFGGSYGYLDSPEALSPGVNEHRLTLSAAYSHVLAHGDNFSATAYFGRDIVEGNSTPSDGWLAEATYYHARDSLFLRYERVNKSELFNVPAGDYVINKLVFGDVHNVYSHDQLEYGVGAYAGVYSFPGSLDALYRKSPLTLGVFIRIRPVRD